MAHLLRISNEHAQRLEATTMAKESLMETTHLEQWIVDHPEVIDDGLKIVAAQFNSWASSEGGSAREALDVLALSSSGQTVVIELKRGGDRKIHLQAITYGALVAGFDRNMLAEAHASWLKKSGIERTTEQALEELTTHLESEWDDDILRLPKLVLVAEHFPDQVITTVQWLTSTVSEALEIECHEYQLFKNNDALLASFQRIFPVVDLEGRRLRPAAAVDADGIRDKIATRTRRAKSVRIIAESGGIPFGARVELDLQTLVRSDVVEAVNSWLDDDESRRRVTWQNDPKTPLKWDAAEDPNRMWTPTALRNEIFEAAGLAEPSFSAADAWSYMGENLYTIAQRIHTAEFSPVDPMSQL